MDEATFQRQVVEAMHLMGYRVAHFRPAQNSRGKWMTPVAIDGKGFPDLVACRPKRVKLRHTPRIIFAELKSEKGRMSAEQMEWIDDLKNAGVEAYVWRPSDWNELVEVLR